MGEVEEARLREKGEKIRDIIKEVNTQRPPIDFRRTILYVPHDDAAFWLIVADKLERLESAGGA